MKHKNLKEITNYCKTNYVVDKNYNLCFDIGANVGGFINAHHNKFKKIVGIEAIPETFTELSNNLKDIKNVELINIAVSDKKDKKLKFYNHKNNSSGSVSSKFAEEMNNEITITEVKTTTYKDLVKTFGVPNYIKVDCEGCEYDFLMGQNLNGVDFISIEIHFDLISDNEREELLKFLLKDFEIVKNKIGQRGLYHSEYNLKRKL